MKGREYTIADLIEFWTSVESRRRAEAGDPTLLLKRLEARRATPHEVADQALIARLIRRGPKKRGRKSDPSLKAKQRQAAFFFHVLMKRGGLSAQRADGRVADFFGTSDDNIRKWRGADGKRFGNGLERVAADLDDFDFWRAALLAEPRIAELLEVAK